MSTALTLATDFAEALPWPDPVTAKPVTTLPAEVNWDSTTLSFVGTTSAKLSVALADTVPLDAAAGAPGMTSAVLRSAFERAAKTLGAGVTTLVENHAPISVAADSETYELWAASAIIGIISVQLQGAAGARGPLSEFDGKLRRINEVDMKLTVEIGKTSMNVRNVLNLEPGNVIELDRSAGEPADILINGRLIAHGEVVVVDQDYAVRITKILDVSEGFN